MNWRARADRLRALPLAVVLAALEAAHDPHDPAKWHTARGVLSVSGPKFMNWRQGVGGGGAIDLVMHVRQMGFGQALEWLEQRFGSLPLRQPTATAPTPSLALPLPVAGMLWSRKGASHLLAVRCALLSGWFEDFWKHYNRAAQGLAFAA